MKLLPFPLRTFHSFTYYIHSQQIFILKRHIFPTILLLFCSFPRSFFDNLIVYFYTLTITRMSLRDPIILICKTFPDLAVSLVSKMATWVDHPVETVAALRLSKIC